MATILCNALVTMSDRKPARVIFVRTAKQHLELEKGGQAREFDAFKVHTTIVMLRYMFLGPSITATKDPLCWA